MSIALIFLRFRIFMATLCPVSACSAILTCGSSLSNGVAQRAPRHERAARKAHGARQVPACLAKGADAQRLAHAVVGQVKLRRRVRAMRQRSWLAPRCACVAARASAVGAAGCSAISAAGVKMALRTGGVRGDSAASRVHARCARRRSAKRSASRQEARRMPLHATRIAPRAAGRHAACREQQQTRHRIRTGAGN